MNDMSGQLVIQTLGYMWTRTGCRRPGRTVSEAVPSVNWFYNFDHARCATTTRIGESNETIQMGRHLGDGSFCSLYTRWHADHSVACGSSAWVPNVRQSSQYISSSETGVGEVERRDILLCGALQRPY